MDMSTSANLAPPPRGVVYGPIKDWGKGSYKLLFNFSSNEGVKGRRQYISQVERDLREEEEVIRVTNGPSVERVVEILARAVTIQDGAANGQLEGYEVEYQTADKEDKIYESITVRPAKATGGAIFGTAHYWTLTTPKGKRNADKRQPVRGVTRLEDIGEEERMSDNEAMRKKNKKYKLGNVKPLEKLGQKMGIDMIEPAVPRDLEDIKANIFGVPPPAWRLQNSQVEWLAEEP
ncbi:hypothetical protein BGX38DRAFT_1284222 [Terfezia claveryi]|nr:hypothetical protein BGX38DRAFT_1284222 [Terfezia claveryi]